MNSFNSTPSPQTDQLRSLPGNRRLQLGAAFLLLSGLVCCYLGGRLLVADLAGWQASQFVQDWYERQRVPSERAWQVAEVAAARAVVATPVAMAKHYDRLGRVHEWHQVDEPLGSAAARESRLAARDAYRQAIELRPLWPYTWAQLAFIKLRLLEFDEEFDLALRRATALGPWRINVNRIVAEVGLLAWHELDPSQRDLVLEAARRTVVQNRKAGGELLATADRLHRSAEVCALLGEERARYKVCR